MTVVLDSSMLLARMVADPRAAFALRTIAHALNEGAVAPTLLPSEVVSVMVREVRKGAVSRADRDHQLRMFAALDIRLAAAPDVGALLRIAELAEQEKLTGYDATFLDLAISLRAELATLDEGLAKAGIRSGLTVHFTPMPQLTVPPPP